MVITKDIKGYCIWDLPKGTKPWVCNSDYDGTFICWKVVFNEFYSYCEELTEEQAKILLKNTSLQNGEQKTVDVNKQKLIELNISTTFMSKNYHDFPERKENNSKTQEKN